ncbi:GNAT family N-acetyltransferase [Salipiger mangrovisoli]|uniref:GNAT family N-acetyltransferase n=1 Tax=Salipiger mangrovisoli TaxID=2865933 RepID=UPI001F11C89E|nr:GNAT family N-acetyltransferase [Salipiger mangrovisoli]
MGKLIIRAAEMRDCVQLVAMANLPGYRHGTLRTPFQSVEWMRKRLESSPPGLTSIVAELDGVVVGNAALHRLDGRRQHVGTLGMGVHDDHRGKRIGTALMAALVDAADNWLAIGRIELVVNADNAAASGSTSALGSSARVSTGGTHSARGGTSTPSRWRGSACRARPDAAAHRVGTLPSGRSRRRMASRFRDFRRLPGDLPRCGG